LSSKERVVFLDRAAFTADELPIPSFDHNWSEYSDTEAVDIVILVRTAQIGVAIGKGAPDHETY